MAYEAERYAGQQPSFGSAMRGEEQPSREFGKWLVGLAFFVSLLALFTSLQLFQLTSEGTSKPTLQRAVAALTEIDPLVDRNYDDLQKRATAAAPGETVELRAYPIDVALMPAEVRGASKDELRRLLLDRSADLMYEQGTAPLHTVGGGKGSVGRFSVGGITDRGLGFLTHGHHDTLAIVTFALGVLSLLLGVTLAVLCRGFGRVASIGAVVFAAALPLLLVGCAAWSYMRIQSGGNQEYVQREFQRIGEELAWIPIRDGLALTALGAVFLAVGVVSALWADRQQGAC